ncbi:MAG: hypothetical protein M9899_09150 [Bdellovibrionaceae bacterium]|nr:hypothetical protein [Pseudobdellovibrionaceae bacterium]
MKKSWDVKDVEIIPMRVSIEEYNQRLDEAAEMVYRYFCQLLENQVLAPETLNVEEYHKQRTGTDG